MAYIPTTFVPLGEAVINAACVWFLEEIRDDGFTSEEVAALFRWKFARAKVAAFPPTGFRRGVKPKGIPVSITSQDREAATETPEIKALRERVNKVNDVPQEAYERLRDLLSTGHIKGFVISEDSGRPHEIEPHLWNTEDAETAHERGLMRFGYGYGWIVGPAVVLRSELDNILAGQPPRALREVGEPADTGSKGGRKSNPDADKFWIEICRLLVHVDVKGGQQGYNETMAQWAINNMAKPYDSETVRKKIGALFKVLGWD